MLKYLIHRPIAVSMSVLAIVVLGIVGFSLLPVSLIPETDIPYVTVLISDPSYSAREMEKALVRPLREQFIQIGGLKDILTESRDGTGTLKLSFEHGSDLDYHFIEVNEKIDRAMGIMPPISRPKTFKASASDLPAFFMTVSSQRDTSSRKMLQLSRFVQDVVSKRLEQLPEVAMVDISGLLEEQILVSPNPRLLYQAGLSLTDFEAALKQSGYPVSNLIINDGAYRYHVQFGSGEDSVQGIADKWITANGRLLQLKDVATISRQGMSTGGFVRSDGKPAFCLAIIKQREAKMSDLKTSVAALTDTFTADYPDLDFLITRDQTQLLTYTIRNLVISIIIAILLSSLAILMFMRDFKSSVLVAFVIPVSLLLSMPLFLFSGLSLNIISLSGILLGVGMMADNAIILVDNITAKWQQCGDLVLSVTEGSREVRTPMLTSILTTCIVFIPLVFVQGIAGTLFKDQAIAITLVLLSSYLVTVIVIPVYYYTWFRHQGSYHASPLLSSLQIDEELGRWDLRWIEWFIRHRWISWGAIGCAVICIFLLLHILPKQRLPDINKTEAILHIDWNTNLDEKENGKRTHVLETSLLPFTYHSTSFVGMQQFLLPHSGYQGSYSTSIYYSCPTPEKLHQAKQALQRILITNWPESVFSFEDANNVLDLTFADNSAPLTAHVRPISPPDLQLESLRNLLKRIEYDIPGIALSPIPVKSEILLVSRAERLALYGISHQEMVTSLKHALGNERLYTSAQGGSSVPVVMTVKEENLSGLLEHASFERKEQRIPFTELLRFSNSEDLQSITADAEGINYPLDITLEDKSIPSAIQSINHAVQANQCFDVTYTGSFFDNRELLWRLAGVLILSILLLYLILAAQFESLIQPLIILIEIVIDLAGVLFLLYICGESLNLMSLIGMIVVTGIVINDSILKVDTINRFRKEGHSVKDAVILASSRRVKAIAMTSLTTILAIMPFLFKGNIGADLQYPLSLAILAGMTVGTFVSLFIVPSLYYALYRK